MPGITVRSANKNISKSSRSKIAKNNSRIADALNDNTTSIYGRVSKLLGNKMTYIMNMNNIQHLAYIRGKLPRINVNDVVLLNIREYESRIGTSKEVYDIIAVLNSKDIHQITDKSIVPAVLYSNLAEDESNFEFDYDNYNDNDNDNNDTPQTNILKTMEILEILEIDSI